MPSVKIPFNDSFPPISSLGLRIRYAHMENYLVGSRSSFIFIILPSSNFIFHSVFVSFSYLFPSLSVAPPISFPLFLPSFYFFLSFFLCLLFFLLFDVFFFLYHFTAHSALPIQSYSLSNLNLSSPSLQL